MKKVLKKISALALCLLLVCGLSVSAFAESSVDYQGGAEKFVFLEGSEFSDTDLFSGFKNVFPGDVLEQKITVKNSLFAPKTVKIYLRAVPHTETNPISIETEEDIYSMKDFLSQLQLSVSCEGKTIYSASPDELDGLSANVLLGEFAPGSSKELLLSLQVPLEMGNEYADRMGEVDWVFTAQELSPPDKPRTGDEASPFLWLSLMGLSLAGAAFLLDRRLKNR